MSIATFYDLKKDEVVFAKTNCECGCVDDPDDDEYTIHAAFLRNGYVKPRLLEHIKSQDPNLLSKLKDLGAISEIILAAHSDSLRCLREVFDLDGRELCVEMKRARARFMDPSKVIHYLDWFIFKLHKNGHSTSDALKYLHNEFGLEKTLLLDQLILHFGAVTGNQEVMKCLIDVYGVTVKDLYNEKYDIMDLTMAESLELTDSISAIFETFGLGKTHAIRFIKSAFIKSIERNGFGEDALNEDLRCKKVETLKYLYSLAGVETAHLESRITDFFKSIKNGNVSDTGPYEV